MWWGWGFDSCLPYKDLGMGEAKQKIMHHGPKKKRAASPGDDLGVVRLGF